MPKVIEYPDPWSGETLKLTVVREKYAVGGSDRIELWCEDGPYCVLSTNLPEYPLPEGEFWVKDWSENEAIADFMLRQGIIVPIDRAVVQTGFVIVWSAKFA